MIDPMTALGGSSIAGGLLGTITALWKASQANKLAMAKVTHDRTEQINEHTIAYQKLLQRGGDPYAKCVFLLATTYCICTAICFLCGDIPVATQSFGTEPTETSIAFGLFTRSKTDNSVFLLTFAGLGTYFMSPISYILTVKLTGAVGK